MRACNRAVRGVVVITITLLLPQIGTAASAKRIALVIGNSAYVNVPPLENPTNDAVLIARTLEDLGFTLVGGGPQLNLDKQALEKIVQEFGNRLQRASVGLFYYAGHGIQVRGSNYLVPINANPTREADVDFQMLDVNLVLRQMDGSGTRLNLILLDACRNNPFGDGGLRGSPAGLVQMRAPEGTLISYATQPGNVAEDGIDGDSPYTQALANVIRRPGLDIFQAFNEVGLEVKRTTGGSQQPWTSTSPIDGEFYFSETRVGASTKSDSTQVKPIDTLRKDLVTDCDKLAASPRDSSRPSGMMGVTIDKVQVVPALTACREAMRQYPDVARFAYQAGRIATLQADFERALRLYQLATSLGSAAAMTDLGIVYQNGEGVAVDITEARKWFEKAVGAGDTYAMLEVGYLDLNASPPDFAGALKWFNRAVAANEPEAMTYLGGMYLQGNGVSKDATEARKLFERAASLGEANAMLELGKMYDKGTAIKPDPVQARKWYSQAAEAGSSSAMTNLGNMYSEGGNLPLDWAEARKWYELAAAQNEPEALGNLGDIYLQGYGVARNVEQARAWYERAASAGDSLAMYYLGRMYDDNGVLPTNWAEARKWYELAAAQNEPRAMAYLGLLYLQGKGIAKNVPEARKYFEAAASTGNPTAMSSLGRMYDDGGDLPTNWPEAHKWYELAADQNEAVAMTNLGRIFLLGHGVAKNPTEARKWFEKAASLNECNAILVLGRLSRAGSEFPLNMSEGQAWFEKGAEIGCATSMTELASNYENGWGVSKDEAMARKWYEKAVAAGDADAKRGLSKLDSATQ